MIRSICSFLAVVLLQSVVHAEAGNVDLPRYPSISPDGKQVAFSWRGDLWKVSSAGGDAVRLTSHPQDDLQSAWSRDGKRIAFGSDRSGAMNIHLMNDDGTQLRQLIDTDRALALTGFGVDEQGAEVVTFAARMEPEWFPGARPYELRTDGKSSPHRIHNAYGVAPVISADGKKVLFNRGAANWSRRNYYGADARDVWLFDRTTKAFTQITKWEGNDGRARWVDNQTIVFASDREQKTVNLFILKLGQDEGQARNITHQTDTDVEEFDISADGKTLVFAMWDKLYTIDLSKDGAKPVALSIRANEDESDRFQQKDVSRLITEAQLSPDGKTMALIAYGEVFVRGVEKGSPVRRVTFGEGRERDLAWSADGTKLFYSSDETGVRGVYETSVQYTRSEIRKQFEASTRVDRRTEEQPDTEDPTLPAPTSNPASTTQPTTRPALDPLRWTEAVRFQTRLLVASDTGDSKPSPSPDGKWLAFQEGVGNLLLMSLATGDTWPLHLGWSDTMEWRWSPDSRHIAFVTEDESFNSDIWIVGIDGKKPAVNITRHPDNDRSPRWSADGKMLAFLSERTNDEYDVWMVWLDKEIEGFTPSELDQYYKDNAQLAKRRRPFSTTRPTTAPATQETDNDERLKRRAAHARHELDLDDAYLRIKRVTTLAGNESDLELSPAGDKFYFDATLGAARALLVQDRDGSEPKKIGIASNVQGISLTGDQLTIVDAGRASIVKLPDATSEPIDISERIRIDLAKQSRQKFLEASSILGQNYYDAAMNGLNWSAVTMRYLPLATAARTADEFDHVAAKFIGELNGSHLGISMPDAPNPIARPYGRLGITTERVEAGFRVLSVLPNGPADRAPTKLQVGDIITEIDQHSFDPGETLEHQLAGLVDHETLVTVQRNGKELDALITPCSFEAYTDLAYRNWRQRTANKVEELSGGKIGYIHIQGMDQNSLDLFERDLYAAMHRKSGLIIDVRNNGGGWTTDRLLASIMYPKHAVTVPRGLTLKNDPDGYPQDRLFIQRYSGPVNMLCNEKSFSNAEIISHAFKTLKRGTLVGQQTSGSVISTDGTTLIDGTTVRKPYRGWFLPDGTNMELHGAMPDLLIPQTPEDESKEIDAQLKAAVDDLMKRLG